MSADDYHRIINRAGGAFTGSQKTVLRDASDRVYQDTAPAGWRDMMISLSVAATGAGTPAMAAFGPTGTIKQRSFGIGDSVYVVTHVDHDILVGSTCYPHIHWSTDGTNVQPVKWQLSYTIAKGHNQENFPADTIITMEEAAHGSAWRHMITEDAAGFVVPEIDSLLIAELKRITNGGTDNVDTVFGLFMDLHYQTDGMSTVNRAPNFYGD